MKFKKNQVLNVKFKSTPLQEQVCQDERYWEIKLKENKNKFVFIEMHGDDDFWMRSCGDSLLFVKGYVTGYTCYIPLKWVISSRENFITVSPKNFPKE